MAERRRSDRYPAELPVDVVERKGDRRCATTDVGRHGIFVRMDDPPAERLLVQLKLLLPSGRIPVLAVVARRVLPGPGRIAGAGLQFFVLAPEAKDKWDAYIGSLRGDRPSSADQRTSPRRLASFLVRLRDVERLREVYTRDISDGGLFVSTPLVRPLGNEVSLVVVHPASDEEFELSGTVVRLQEGPPKGMAIQLTDFGGEEREAFKRFVETGVAALRWRTSAQTRPAVSVPASEVTPVVREGAAPAGTAAGAGAAVTPTVPPREEPELDIDLGDFDDESLDEAHGLSSVEAEISRSIAVEAPEPDADPDPDPDPEAEALRAEIERDPTSLEPRVRLAAHLLAAGQLHQAVAEAREAVELDPEHPVALIGLARALARMERFAEAEVAFADARKHGHPGDATLAAAIARGLAAGPSVAPAKAPAD